MFFGIFFPATDVNNLVRRLDNNRLIRRLYRGAAVVATGDHAVMTAPLPASCFVWYVHMTATLLFDWFFPYRAHIIPHKCSFVNNFPNNCSYFCLNDVKQALKSAIRKPATALRTKNAPRRVRFHMYSNRKVFYDSGFCKVKYPQSLH